MIKYQLHCDAGHAFEGWYSGSADFDALKEAGKLVCAYYPDRSSHTIEKAIMAPNIGRSSSPKTSSLETREREVSREFIHKNFRDVGEAFVEKARAGEEMIRGLATWEEARELIREGCDISPIPLAKADLN